jgi:putative transposase
LFLVFAMKTSVHITRPMHLYVDDSAYFITASLYQHRRLLNDDIKTYLVTLMHEVFSQYGWVLNEWVVLDNHYHVLCKSRKGRDLPKIMGKLHRLSASLIRENNPMLESRVWYNYWDYCPRNDKEYNTRLCYLLNNPRKHGYVEKLDDWQWSSFHQYTEKEHLRKLFHDHKDYQTLALPEEASL